jgi:cytochrome c biogenesis protein CcdA
MLSSIHPLGERARNNMWWVTVSAFTAGSLLGGAALGALLGFAGSSFAVREDLALMLLGTLAVVAGGLDLLGVKAPGPSRQVNERWIGTLRGTVYGFGFGAQLGAGIATFVVTWGVWVVLVAEFLTGSVWNGALVGAVFGLGRAVAPLAAGLIDRPSRLTSFSAGMARLAQPTHLGAGFVTAALGVVAVLSGV